MSHESQRSISIITSPKTAKLKIKESFEPWCSLCIHLISFQTMRHSTHFHNSFLSLISRLIFSGFIYWPLKLSVSVCLKSSIELKSENKSYYATSFAVLIVEHKSHHEDFSGESMEPEKINFTRLWSVILRDSSTCDLKFDESISLHLLHVTVCKVPIAVHLWTKKAHRRGVIFVKNSILR